MRNHKFTILKSEQVLKTPFIEVLRETVLPSVGQEFTHIFTNHPGSCVVVPLTEDGNVILINQYRHPIRAFSLEVVAGKLEGKDLIKDAKRELEEEIGCTCGSIEQLGTFFVSNSNTNEKAYIFLARKLRKTKINRERTEYISEIIKVKLEEALDMILRGEIADAHTIIALFLTQRRLRSTSQ